MLRGKKNIPYVPKGNWISVVVKQRKENEYPCLFDLLHPHPKKRGVKRTPEQSGILIREWLGDESVLVGMNSRSCSQRIRQVGREIGLYSYEFAWEMLC